MPYKGRPAIEHIFNMYDMEGVASHNCTKEAWGYLNSGGDDEVTLRENTKAYHRVWLRPRVLRDVSKVDISSTVLGGQKMAIPFYMSATALGKLYDPEGEKALGRGCGNMEMIQMAPTLASCS